MEIILTSVTGIKTRGTLNPNSGAIELENGEITHLQYEKSFNKKVEKYVAPEIVAPIAPLKTQEESKPEEIKEEASTEQSEELPKKKNKRK